MFKEQEVAMEIGNAVLNNYIAPVIERLRIETDQLLIKTLQKEYSDAYRKAHQELDSYKITNIEYREDKSIVITLARPGIFIGYKGKNIDRISEYLQKNLPGSKIRIKEDKIYDYLYPQDWSGEGEYDEDGYEDYCETCGSCDTGNCDNCNH
jgi:hypothetical protein